MYSSIILIHHQNCSIFLTFAVLRTRGQKPVFCAALPEPTEIGTTGYCVIEGEWEYAPRWNFPDNSVSTMTLEECAIACGEHELCTGATFLDYPDNTDKKNCWMKSWESPPAPAGTPCYGGEFLGLASMGAHM